jgi:serine/threonine protein phosphatase 1
MKRYVISDIHGNGRAFLKLLDYVDPDPEELVILGDLGDRGLETWEVYKECALLIDEGATLVRGNHDFWLQMYLQGQLSHSQFTREEVGGLTTLKSFEIAKNLGESVDEVVYKVLRSMLPYYEDEHYIFVHAGIDPRIPYMENQNINTLLLGCDDWKNPHIEHPFDQTIVFGHTPTPFIHKAITPEDARIWSSRKARKMAVDTGAGYGWRLTLADLYEGMAYAYDFEKRDIIMYRFKRKEKY